MPDGELGKGRGDAALVRPAAGSAYRAVVGKIYRSTVLNSLVRHVSNGTV
jgi:hypothetical protein